MTFASASAVAILGIWLLVALALIDAWTVRQLASELCLFTFCLIVLCSAVPTLHASWATRPIADDDD